MLKMKKINNRASCKNWPHKALKKRKKVPNYSIVVEETREERPTVPSPSPLWLESMGRPVPATRASSNTFDRLLRKNRGKMSIKTRIARPAKPNSKIKMHGRRSNGGERGESVEHSESLPEERLRFLCATPEETAHMNILASTDSMNFRKAEDDDDDDASVPFEKNLEPSIANNGSGKVEQSPRFYSFRNKVLAIMEVDGKFYFNGKLRIRVLYGAVKIYGYYANVSRTRAPLAVYSPRAYSPIAIETTDVEISNEDSIARVWDILASECIDSKNADSLRMDVCAAKAGWAILLLENFDDRLTDFLGWNFPFRLFPQIDDSSNRSWRDSRRAEMVLQANLYFNESCPESGIDSKNAIEDVFEEIAQDRRAGGECRTIIVGGKGVGKSTAARYLINKLLRTCDTVVFLDLDLGQPEFTPPGCISVTIVDEPLLGPNFTHLRTPYHQLYIGNPDVTQCLTRYVDGSKHLIDLVDGDPQLAGLPLVVNTMGYCKGIGWDLARFIIKTLLPTNVVQILSRRSRNNFEESFDCQTIDRQSFGWTCRKEKANDADRPTRHRLRVVRSEAEPATESWSLEASRQRELVTISYLSDIVKVDDSSMPPSRGLSPNIAVVPPYSVPFDAVYVSPAEAFVTQVLSAMNGNIVALCGVDVESVEESSRECGDATAYPRVLTNLPLATCYGFGVLRGVDTERKLLFLSTPLPVSRARHVNCLVGCANTPPSLVQRNRHRGAPYTGCEYELPTSHVPRRGISRPRHRIDED